MATLLTKPVSRQLIRPGQKGPVIITLEPGDLISFREKNKKTSYTVSLHNVQTLALMQYILQDHKARCEDYNRKKKAGYKGLRKPKQPTLEMFSKMYRNALQE